MEMDLEKKRYETFDELYTYCFRAASAVGLICIEIFGYSEDAEAAHQHAEELGIAMQLTNILRDVREDMTLGRIYLPGEDLARFNYSEAELSRYEFTPAFRDLMKFQVERARDYFQRSEALFPLIDTQTRYCPVLLKRLYSKILDRIESQGYDVFSRRPALSRLQKLCMLMTAARDARKARRAASKK
jgi:phytoene synthase